MATASFGWTKEESVELDKLTNGELVALRNILAAPCLKADDLNTKCDQVEVLLRDRGFYAEDGERLYCPKEWQNIVG